MPVGVHLAVVDPGVGSRRRCVVLTGADGRRYVGPDNGLLVPAAERLGGIASVHELTNPAYRLESVSLTFHGRDVFSPAAAHLATGVDPAELGPELDPATLVRIPLPEPEVGTRRVRATILYVDRFGNVQLNLGLEHLEQIGIHPGTQVELQLPLDRYFAVAATTFADARPGDIILYEDAYGNVSIAIRDCDAADMFSAEAGQDVLIGPRG
jgi:S-adenosylmethionine hydrolase